ncbi:MAG: Stk1 family PASTA domain-containing Ser/Thr kinase [Lachnospiraceae bacterium]|nr:Stk1 family PASTA domain-containing Ser/Thr kinase [Lachnospiraceae bacterium]
MLTEGMYIADRYEIVGKVGTGGMSDVYKAKDHILGRYVAIKVLKQEFSEDRNFVVKFRTEAQSAAGLEHPNIVNIYDVGSEDGFHYIVMEYVEGITLKTYIEKKGKLSFKESVSIAIQVARGIEAAHNKDIIHRDIKPQNIIISTEGKVKVTDFGIAKAISSNTVSSDVMGSVHYTSPEHARNGQVDGRSDIYSLGIVMYEMVTGRVPFDGETTVAVAIQHLQEEMISPASYATDLPISMEKIILKCCQKSPDRRYQSIAELLNDLRKALNYPNEDFVVIAPGPESGPTKIITPEELREISDMAPDDEEYDDDEYDDDEYDDDEVFGDEEEGAEEELNPKMKRLITIGFVAISAIIVILVIYLIGYGLGLFGKHSTTDSTETETTSESQQVSESTSEEFEMVDLFGMTVDEAELELENLGLYISIEYEKDSENEVPEGQIFEQDPVAGTMVKKGDTVTVKVVEESSPEVEYITVPNVVGQSESSAKSTIEDKGLKYEVSYEYSDSVDAGDVISQSPTEGSVTEGSTIKIVVSQGKESVTIPSNLAGKSFKNVKSTLENLGLNVEAAYEHSDDVEKDYVISVSPKSGKTVEKGSTVTVTVSLGAEVHTYLCDTSFTINAENAASVTYTLTTATDGTVVTQTKNVTNGETVTVQKANLSDASGTLEYTIYDAEGTPISSGSETVNFSQEE